MSIMFLIAIPDTQGKAGYALSSVTAFVRNVYVYKFVTVEPCIAKELKTIVYRECTTLKGITEALGGNTIFIFF